LLTVAVGSTVVGATLLMVLVGEYRAAGVLGGRRSPAGSVLLAAMGVAAAVGIGQLGGVGLPSTPAKALRGEAAFAANTESSLTAGWLASEFADLAGAKVWVLGDAAFAVSLGSGRPNIIHAVTRADAAAAPLRAGDVLAIHASMPDDGFRRALRSRGLSANLHARSGSGRDEWRLYDVRQRARALKPGARSLH
jgi:hypothetical protein